jgi:hypothetical protein
MEPGEMVWQGKVGPTPLKVGVSHAERIVAEWESPQGKRHKVASSVPEFERSVLFQLLLTAGESDASSTEDIVTAIEKAQAERPAPATSISKPRRRKNPKAKFHRRSRRPPRRR